LSFSQPKEHTEIDQIFSAWNQKNVPGGALGIIKDGALLYAKGYGMANLEYDIPNSASSVFRIASTSKQFTAACIILLKEQGKLALDDTLQELFPDFPDYAKKITIKHLLNHTSGIRDYLQLASLKGIGDDDVYTDETIMKWLVQQSSTNFDAGAEYLYSNSGYWLLGQIVEKVSGMNLADFAKKELFDPLKMNDTHFHNDHTQIVKNRASGYMPDRTGNYKISMTNLDMIGDGGIFTTINDIKKWDDAFYNSTVLSSTFWKEMTQQGVLNDGTTIAYAAGLNIGEYKGLKTIRHGGAFVGFRAELLRFPKEKLTIAIFANRGDANPSLMANQVADILLKNKLVDKAKEPTKTVKIETPSQLFELKQLTGDYEVQPQVVVSISIKNDSLNVLQNWNKSTYNIVKTQGNTFQIPGESSINFTFSDLKDGFTQTLTVLQDGRETKATRKEKVDVSNINLEEYVGKYYSKELEVTYSVIVEKEMLKVGIEGKEPFVECTVTNVDQFSMRFGLLNFKRTNGKISSVTLDSGRVKNVLFEKK
jgi:CubicO group peptidase (beta-lactamase class C family)